MKGASDAETFHDFAVSIYYYIMGLSKGLTRIDIVGDQYFDHSVKEQIRKDRGTGTRKLFEDHTKFPKNLREDFLRNSQNKEDLNRSLAEKIISLHSGSQTVVVTYDKSILSNDNNLITAERINNCTAEEADPRLVRHAMHCAEKGFHNIVVRTIDTDVLVLLISYIPYLDAVCQSNIYAMMGTGGNIDYYDVNNISSTIGYSFCKGLPFFYSFTGCDSVSSFSRIGKCTFWDNVFSQQNLEELIKVFQELSNQPENVTSEQIDILKIFVQRIYYSKKLNLEGLNKERLRHFKRQADTNLRIIPV